MDNYEERKKQYIYIHELPLYVLKKVYDRNIVNRYRICLLLGVIIFNLICIYIRIYCIYSIGLKCF